MAKKKKSKNNQLNKILHLVREKVKKGFESPHISQKQQEFFLLCEKI